MRWRDVEPANSADAGDRNLIIVDAARDEAEPPDLVQIFPGVGEFRRFLAGTGHRHRVGQSHGSHNVFGRLRSAEVAEHLLFYGLEKNPLVGGVLVDHHDLRVGEREDGKYALAVELAYNSSVGHPFEAGLLDPAPSFHASNH